MMKNVFRVTIHYHGNTNQNIDVIATDDVKARAAAIRADAKAFGDNLEKAPGVEFCEVVFICEAVSA